MLDLGRTYAVDSQWVLQGDRGRSVLYLLSLYQSRYFLLSSVEAALLALLDGRRTVGDALTVLAAALGDSDTSRCAEMCEKMLQRLNSDSEVVTPSRSSSSVISLADLSTCLPNAGTRADSPRLARPFRAMIALSNRCATDCVYCYAERRSCAELGRDGWRRIADDLCSLDITLLDLTGGDPLAARQGSAVICDLTRRGFLFLLSTKCFVSRRTADTLVAAGFLDPVRGVGRQFQVSLDAAQPCLADGLTNTPGYFARAEATISNLLAAGIPVRVKAVLTPANVDQVEPLVDLFVPKGVKSFGFSVYSRSGYRHDDSLFLDAASKARAAEACDVVKARYPGIDLMGDAVSYTPQADDQESRETRWRTRAGCSGGFSSIGIAPDGKVILCEQIPQRPPFVVGDLTKQTIAEVWNSHDMHSFLNPPRDLFAGTICYHCDEFDACHYEKGWCYRDAYFFYGTPHAPPPACPRVENPPRMN